MHEPNTPNEPQESQQTEPSETEDEMGLGEVFRRLGPAGYLAVAWTAVPALGGFLLLANMGTISTWLVENQGLGLALYVVIFVFSAGFGLLPTYAQALLGGWAFGMAVGFPAALAGITGGAIVGYLAARMASDDRAERLIAENAKARAVRDALIGHGFWKTLGMVALLRVPLNSPFAITNLVMASVGVPKRAFVIGTALGMAPRTGLAVAIADGTRRTSQELSKSAINEAGFGWTKIAAIGSMVVVFGIVMWIGNRAVKRVTESEPRA